MNDAPDSGSEPPARASRAPGTDGNEATVWTAHPGQVIHLPIYLAVIVIAAIPAIFAPWPLVLVTIVPLLVGAWFVLSARCIRYELTDERLRRVSGVLTRRGEEIELYRVEDTSPTAPLLYRLYGRGNVEVLSTDRTASELTLRAIKDHENVRRMIRDRVEAMRRAKGVRVVE